jgi:hypothetical protein
MVSSCGSGGRIFCGSPDPEVLAWGGADPTGLSAPPVSNTAGETSGGLHELIKITNEISSSKVVIFFMISSGK